MSEFESETSEGENFIAPTDNDSGQVDTNEVAESLAIKQPDNEATVPEVVRDFSKEYQTRERSELSRTILELRQNYFRRRNEIESEIASLHEQIVTTQAEAENLSSQVETLGAGVGELKISFADVLLLRAHQKRRDHEVAEAEHNAVQRTLVERRERLSSQLASLDESLQNLAQLRIDRHELDEAKNKLLAFYEGSGAKYQEYLADLPQREISNIVKTYPVSVVHALSEYEPKENSLLNRFATRADKLRICLAFKPVVSTSTCLKSATENLWDDEAGLVVAEGTVTAAYRSDAATVAGGLHSRGRSLPGAWRDHLLADDIAGAISGRDRAYNEIIVDNPDFSGIYVISSPTDHEKTKLSKETLEAVQLAEQLGLPVYLLVDGQYFHAQFSSGGGWLVRGEKATDDEIGKKFDISEAQRQDIVSEILVDPPFAVERLGIADIERLSARRAGWCQFFELAPEGASTETRSMRFLDQEYTFKASDLPSHQYMRIVREIPTSTDSLPYYLPDAYIHDQPIQLGWSNLDGTRTVVRKAEQYVATIRAWVQDNLPELVEKYSDQGADRLKQDLAYAVYGFAEAARESGREDLDIEARELANELLPQSVYDEVVARRLDDQGRIRISENELPK